LDWEDSENERQAFAQILNDHPTSTALVWPQDLSNPRLAASFRGIERFLGTPLVESVVQQQPDLGITQRVGNPPIFELQPAQQSPVKQALARACERRDNVQDVRPLIDALDWLDSNIPGRAQQPRLPSI
jgi:hypothetical protein